MVDPNNANNTGTDTTNVAALVAGADLAIQKSDNGVAQTGAFLTYSLLVTNNGPDRADSVTVTDEINQNTTLLVSTAAWASDVIPATTFANLNLIVADLVTEPVAPGTDVVYEITVTNPGPDDAIDPVVYDTLGPYLSYVSDTGGCTLQTGTDGLHRLACPIGTIPAGSAVTFPVTAKVALAGPISFTIEDGDCTGVEDLCDRAVVATRSSDADPGDNFDSEPTKASANLNCNDGIMDPGEECEPPTAETCNNGIDDGEFLPSASAAARSQGTRRPFRGAVDLQGQHRKGRSGPAARLVAGEGAHQARERLRQLHLQDRGVRESVARHSEPDDDPGLHRRRRRLPDG